MGKISQEITKDKSEKISLPLHRNREKTIAKHTGEMAEWSIAAVLKTVEPQGSGGSNPSLSASFLA